MVEALQKIVNEGRTYKLSGTTAIKVKNGIYFLFENGEQKSNDLQRIVRIGINESNNRFVSRLQDHFSGSHRGSVFRKHIGRALLIKSGKETYLPLWDLSNKQVALKRDQVDWFFEEKIERKITSYVDLNCSFVILKVGDQERRIELEKRLIATLAFKAENGPSKNWIGNFHPDKRIFESGLWNIQHLKYKTHINENDLRFLKNNLIL